MSHDPYAMERFLLPNIHGEGHVFDAMLDDVTRQISHLTALWASYKNDPEFDHEHADSLIDEGASAQALQTDIAEIALTAVFHWVERRCTGLLLNKAGTGSKDEDRKLAKEGFPEKVTLLAARGVDLTTLPQYGRINGVLRPFANSWKHQEGPNKPLLDALGLPEQGHYDLLDDDAIRAGLAEKAGLDANADMARIVRAYADLATKFLLGMYHLAYPRPAK